MRSARTSMIAGLIVGTIAQPAAAEVARAPLPVAPPNVAAPAPQPVVPAEPAPATPKPPPAVVPAQASVPDLPQQTTASFADWTLRCTRATPAPAACEIVQTLTSQDRTVAQVAIGRIGKAQPLHLTILVPPSVTIAPAPALAQRDGDPPAVELAWRRCLPVGCLAEGTIGGDVMLRIGIWTEPGRIVFADGNGRPVALPFSPKGLAQALDALGREDAG